MMIKETACFPCVPGVVADSAPRSRLTIGRHDLANDVLLAPLSGISDVPFRRLARRFGAGLVFSEMVASGELLKGYRESLQRAMWDGVGLHAVQLAGRDPEAMGEAARILADGGADIIDINFGCPAKKVVGGQSGSALMREPELALRIVEATVAGAGDVPVTLKMRLGWDHASINSPSLAARAESAGVRLVTIHGRTRQQFYEGLADWNAIAAVKAAVSIPVVANGDLVERAQLAPMRQASGCDAVMVGRGACGRPWLPGLLAGAIDEAALGRICAADLVCEHFEMMLDHYGPMAGLRQSRKHLGWYLDRAAMALEVSAAALKGDILRLDGPQEILARITLALGSLRALDLQAPASAARREAA